MAIIANTFTRYSAIGIREELSNIIYNISPEETPFLSNGGRETVRNTFFEWQTDSLATAAANYQIDGDDVAAFPATTPTTRIGNYTNISRKLVILADNLEVINEAGRTSELAYQITKLGQELKRDQETTVLANSAAVGGGTGTARQTAGLPAWLKTNSSRGTGGTDPTVSGGIVNAAAGDATTGNRRAFTLTILDAVIESVWTQGGTPKMLMVGPFNKTVVSGFSGIAANRYQITKPEAGVIIGAADIYVSDFGTVNIVPNRFQRERDAYVLDTEFWATCFLRPLEVIDLAKTGDAEKRMLLVEYGLKVKNEAALGVCADLTAA
jgi:hypothetical protein